MRSYNFLNKYHINFVTLVKNKIYEYPYRTLTGIRKKYWRIGQKSGYF
jgi:hypothetical protein